LKNIRRLPSSLTSFLFRKDCADTLALLCVQLVFTSTDPTLDIVRNMAFYDEEFMVWLAAKADKSEDLEEREALRSLSDMIVEVRFSWENMIWSPRLLNSTAGIGDGERHTELRHIPQPSHRNKRIERSCLMWRCLRVGGRARARVHRLSSFALHRCR
jgi:hypothetical protein